MVSSIKALLNKSEELTKITDLSNDLVFLQDTFINYIQFVSCSVVNAQQNGSPLPVPSQIMKKVLKISDLYKCVVDCVTTLQIKSVKIICSNINVYIDSIKTQIRYISKISRNQFFADFNKDKCNSIMCEYESICKKVSNLISILSNGKKLPEDDDTINSLKCCSKRCCNFVDHNIPINVSTATKKFEIKLRIMNSFSSLINLIETLIMFYPQMELIEKSFSEFTKWFNITNNMIDIRIIIGSEIENDVYYESIRESNSEPLFKTLLAPFSLNN